MKQRMINRHDNACSGAIAGSAIEDFSAPQILVVDDCREVRDFVVSFLRLSGYQVAAAENGIAAQLALTGMHPSLIVSDLRMPLCDGWELLSFCHTNYPDIAVLLTSSDSLGQHAEVESFASGFVSKPFDLKFLRSEVDRLVARSA